MQRVTITPPVIQIALDYPTVEEAIAMARLGVEAGVDWLEVGTPLIVCQGIPAIGRLAKAFPDHPILADYKTMDSGGKNVERTLEQGGHIMTVCANAPDETVRSAVAAGQEDRHPRHRRHDRREGPGRPRRQCAEWGVDIVYLHYGADQRRADESRDSTQWLGEVLAAVSIPVGVGCFGVEDAVRAVRRGAEYVVIGHPLISGPDPLAELKRFVKEVRANYRPRTS